MRRFDPRPRAALAAALTLLAACHRGDAEPAAASCGSAANAAKAELLRAVAARAASSRHVFLDAGLLGDFRRLRAASERAPSAQQLGARLSLAECLLFHGEIDESIGEYESCVALVAERAELERSLPDVLYRLGLAYFRLAERQNCIAHHTAQSCIFPLAGGALHIDRQGAAKALATFERVLALDPAYREAQWLLNVAHMALGTYPCGVPPAYLYPPERFASEAPLGRFVDVAPALGLARSTRAGSVIVDDLDGDGLLDVLSSSFDPTVPLALFHNRGERGFEDASERAGLSGQLGGINLVQGDADGDGRLDVLVLRGGGLFGAGEMPCSLLVQRPGGCFEDATAAAGIEVFAPTRSAAFADVEGDGDLDLFVGYESAGSGPGGEVRHPSRLYRNDGAARFDDIGAAAGVSNGRMCVGAAFGDVDADGFPDLYVSNQLQPNRLYRNRGDGTFVDVAPELGVTGPTFSNATWFFDYDNDGDLDLFVAQYSHGGEDRLVAEYYWSGRDESDGPRLYENDGRGAFADVTRARGLHRVAYPQGAGCGDVDGDGYPDIYLATGSHGMSSLWPNVMLRNDRGKGFQDVTTAGGLGHLQKGNGMAFGDLDLDGDQDLFLQVGGFHLDDRFGDVLFENPGHGNRFLCVELEGVRANRFAIGARIRVRIDEPEGQRDVFAFVLPQSSFGGSSLRQEIGLGRARAIVALEVHWPGSGLVQRFDGVPLDRAIAIREGDAAPRLLARRAFALGAARH